MPHKTSSPVQGRSVRMLNGVLDENLWTWGQPSNLCVMSGSHTYLSVERDKGKGHIERYNQLKHLRINQVKTLLIKMPLINSALASENYLFDSRNDPKLMHKTYWKVHLNSEEVFLRDIAAVLSPIIKIKYLINKHVDELTNLFIAKKSSLMRKTLLYSGLFVLLQPLASPRLALTAFVGNFRQFLYGEIKHISEWPSSRHLKALSQSHSTSHHHHRWPRAP